MMFQDRFVIQLHFFFLNCHLFHAKYMLSNVSESYNSGLVTQFKSNKTSKSPRPRAKTFLNIFYNFLHLSFPDWTAMLRLVVKKFLL